MPGYITEIGANVIDSIRGNPAVPRRLRFRCRSQPTPTFVCEGRSFIARTYRGLVNHRPTIGGIVRPGNPTRTRPLKPPWVIRLFLGVALHHALGHDQPGRGYVLNHPAAKQGYRVLEQVRHRELLWKSAGQFQPIHRNTSTARRMLQVRHHLGVAVRSTFASAPPL